MKHLFWVIIVILVQVFSTKDAMAQADTLMDFCARNLPSPYISDGQQYRTPIAKGESAEFNVTFYGGSVYRLAACMGLEDGNIIYTVMDKDRNELFCSKDHKNSAFWDFKFQSTVDCIIEARVDEIAKDETGIAILLIGFKN